MSAFVDAHRERFGIEPICRTLGVSASAYFQRRTGARSVRTVTDERLTALIQRCTVRTMCYGQRRMHAALVRAGETVGRDQVGRLMRENADRVGRTRSQLELVVVVEYVSWFNSSRLHSTLGYRTPDEAEAECRHQHEYDPSGVVSDLPC